MTDEQIIQKAREAGMTGEATPAVIEFVRNLLKAEIEMCARIAETPIGEYEVVVACGTEPAPSRITQYANWQDIAKAIRTRVRP